VNNSRKKKKKKKQPKTSKNKKETRQGLTPLINELSRVISWASTTDNHQGPQTSVLVKQLHVVVNSQLTQAKD